MDMDMFALRCFVVAAHTGSMSRAAAALDRSQPAVSQQIRRLEDILGRRVLRRIPTGTELTRAGEALLPLANRILALNEEAKNHIAGRMAGGRRRIGMIEDVAASSLQMALADFAHVHPEIELDVLVADGETLRDAFAAGQLDLAVGEPEFMGGTPRKRRVFALAWVSAPSFDTNRDPLPLVLFRQACQWRVRTIKALDRAGRRWRAAFESGSLTAVQAAVRAGVGAATMLAANVETGMIVLKGRNHKLPTAPRIELGLYRRPGSHGDPVADVLEDLLWKSLR